MNHSASKAKGLAWLAVACISGVAVAFGISPLVHTIPWRWEQKLAVLLGSDTSGQECDGSLQAQALLRTLVKRIYPVMPEDASFTIDVRIVKNSAINAYATLGGTIFIYSGLLKQAESAEELAGIVSHEIGHIQHRDILEGVITHMLTAQGISMIFSGSPSVTADWAQYFLNMNFTRSQETLADEAGLLRLQKAHVDNKGFKHFFERMEKSESASAFISDHPSNHARLDMAETFDNKDIKPILGQDEWNNLKNYCGKKTLGVNRN